jgi:hypothetical protein
MVKEAAKVTTTSDAKPLQGDPRAVAKQQIFAETVKAEMRNHHKNRTTDFTFNPRNSNFIVKLILS